MLTTPAEVMGKKDRHSPLPVPQIASELGLVVQAQNPSYLGVKAWRLQVQGQSGQQVEILSQK